MPARVPILAFVALAFLAVPSLADEMVVAIQFEGQVTAVQDRSGLLGGSVSVGTPFTGRYVFSISALDSDPAIPDEANYSDALLQFTLEMGEVTLQGTGPDNEIEIRNRNTDTYLVRDRSLVLLGQGLHAVILLQDLDGRALSDERLPLGPPDLAEFEIHELSVTSPALGPGFGLSGNIGSIAMAAEECYPACPHQCPEGPCGASNCPSLL